MFPPFVNEPLSDFSVPENNAAYRQALEKVRRRLGGHWPLVIAGEEVDTGRKIASINPCKPAEVVGTAAAAGPAQVDLALDAAWRAFPDWAARPAEVRATALVKLAAELRRRKLELAAWETLEASKNWLEAEADVAEAIDFCEYYARQALDFAKPLPVLQLRGEINQSWLQPLGAGAVIPPWNFPLAILAGMAVGPAAAGNTVVIKPSSYTPVIAAIFMEAVAAAGLPPGVVNFLPGQGSEVGDYLVDHARTRFINFTGSRLVGVRLTARAAQVHPGQHWLKRAFTELGGKDAVVIDETADLDAAIPAVVASAYGFQGQKCSAASRLIVVQEVYDAVVERLVAAVHDVKVGSAEDNFPVAAVISETQHKMILNEIESGKKEAKLAAGGRALDLDGGYFLEPTIFIDAAPDSRLAQHEIFGPVLAMIRAADFEDAVRIFNNTEYGLTGGLFSRSRERLERARREFNVGNLYLNRKITGALVGVQPFGGFKMSGSNAKAGGPDYLRLFLEMKTVAERL
ncbi:MAG: L-glutamate gamma-semialdehyde dehydrogenase [Deltaproteobacteria bacterium]|nr:MAG: L-glutamate gamma-semialdehyde dehydrogenase [Deltaproteobacteria bacterium]